MKMNTLPAACPLCGGEKKAGKQRSLLISALVQLSLEKSLQWYVLNVVQIGLRMPLQKSQKKLLRMPGRNIIWLKLLHQPANTQPEQVRKEIIPAIFPEHSLNSPGKKGTVIYLPVLLIDLRHKMVTSFKISSYATYHNPLCNNMDDTGFEPVTPCLSSKGLLFTPYRPEVVRSFFSPSYCQVWSLVQNGLQYFRYGQQGTW